MTCREVKIRSNMSLRCEYPFTFVLGASRFNKVESARKCRIKTSFILNRCRDNPEQFKKEQITLPDVFVSSYQYLIRKLEQSHVIPQSHTSTNTTTDASAKIQGKSETSSRSHLKFKMAKCWSILPLLSAIATFVIEWRLLERIRILLLGEY